MSYFEQNVFGFLLAIIIVLMGILIELHRLVMHGNSMVMVQAVPEKKQDVGDTANIEEGFLLSGEMVLARPGTAPAKIAQSTDRVTRMMMMTKTSGI